MVLKKVQVLGATNINYGLWKSLQKLFTYTCIFPFKPNFNFHVFDYAYDFIRF